MSAPFDIAVLGGGPAGMAAASLAARAGARAVLLDERHAPGGQAYREPVAGGAAPDDADRRDGDASRAELAASGAVAMTGALVWGLGGGPLVAQGAAAEPFRLDILAAGTVASIEARALIVCAGAHERVVPFPGWTRPGVIGLAAAMIMLRAEGVSPGRRVVVAGTGPLLAAVAAGIIGRGGTVAAIIDAAPRRAWLATLRSLSGDPSLFRRGAGWLARIIAGGVPVLSGRRIARVLGEPGGISAVEVVALDGGAARRIGCDAVCAGHGMVPATEATRLFRAAHHFDAARGGWIPRLDDWGRASVAGLYAAGDCAGIAGAAAAPRTGRIAALGALQDLGLITPADAAEAAADARGRLAASVGVAAAMAAIMAPPRALVAAIPGDCVVCRCEDITRAELEAAADAGARDINQLKQFTRCGMGPCQGRLCGEAAAELLALRVGDRARVGCFTSRPPLRPVPLRDLLGEFDYADIPIPAPAPL